MSLQLAELQKSDEETKKIRATRELQEGWKDISRVWKYQRLSIVLKIIQT